MKIRALAIAAGMSASVSALAQSYVMVVDSSATARVMLFSPVDGSLVNANFIVEPAGGTPFAFTTPKNAIQVGNEIWVSDQVLDNITRFDLSGNFLGTYGGGATGGLDNIRGIAYINGSVYISNGGTGNGAPGANNVVVMNTAGSITGNFPAAASPFDVFQLNSTDLLVSGSSNNPDVTRHDFAGALLGTWYNSAVAGDLNFAQQITRRSNGNILIAGFTSNSIHQYDSAGVSLGSLFAASGARGVFELQNGDILWTASSGVHVKNLITGGDVVVVAVGSQYADLLTLPAAGCYANCDDSTSAPILNALDFGCFLTKFAAGDSYANCDNSTNAPVLNALDFGCFLTKFAAGCT